MKFGDEPPNTYGTGYSIPLNIENLPAYIEMILDDHLLNYSTSDVMDVLAGKKSFRPPRCGKSKRGAYSTIGPWFVKPGCRPWTRPRPSPNGRERSIPKRRFRRSK